MNKVLIKSNSPYKFDRKYLRRKIDQYLKKTGLEEVELSLAFVGKRKMRHLNKTFRKLNKISDVLAFAQEEPRLPSGVLMLGDIVVCYPEAQREAIDYQEEIDIAIWDFVKHGLNRLTKRKVGAGSPRPIKY